ncbi:MAG: hypothetical protein LBD24_03970 [Spirochaetaceae bacterium]|nr:hypothetical protein [Spirochaetaceae bacterium]
MNKRVTASGCSKRLPAKRGEAGGDCLEARRSTWRGVVRGASLEAYETAGGCGDGAERSRAWAVQAPSPDTVLHYFETTGGHAEAVGDGAAMLKQPEAAPPV